MGESYPGRSKRVLTAIGSVPVRGRLKRSDCKEEKLMREAALP